MIRVEDQVDAGKQPRHFVMLPLDAVFRGPVFQSELDTNGNQGSYENIFLENRSGLDVRGTILLRLRSAAD